MKEMNKSTTPEVQDAILEAARPILAGLGISIERAGGTIHADGVSATLKFAVRCTGKEAAAAREASVREKWTRFASFVGMKPDDFGKAFYSQGEHFTISDLEPSRPKFPVIATRADGKRFKFTAAAVKQHLDAQSASRGEG